jgi:predicted CoA-substrate-specific enzyme activase
VDVGASTTKVVLLNSREQVCGRSLRRSGIDYAKTATSCLDDALSGLGGTGDRLIHTVSTGYGRRNVPFSEKVCTEIQCHGVGCFHTYKRKITVIDIGGQDNKIIRLNGSGKRTDFKMNRKCAAGTGAFLEEIALRLDIAPDELDGLASRAETAVRLNSFCTVFASTEMLSHLRRGESLEGLIRGAFVSVVERVAEMDQLSGDVVLTGGVVAHNPTIRDIFENRIGSEVLVPPHPQYTGALGAALIARNEHREKTEDHHA